MEKTSRRKQSVCPQLPPEVWIKILCRVERSIDLHSCSQACRMFNSILKETKQYWFFDLLLPSILTNLDLKSVLSLRLVCKDWNSKFDTVLNALTFPKNRSYEYGHMFGKPQQLPNELQKLTEPLKLRSSRIAQRFTEEIQSAAEIHQANLPVIIGRSLQIGYQIGNWFFNERLFSDYWNDILKFLTLIRSQLDSLILSDNHQERNLYLDYTHILLALVRCPNLRNFEYDYFASWNDEVVDLDDLAGGNEWTENRPFINPYILENFPLPTMACLETLILQKSTPIALQIPLIQKYASQLRSLEFTLSHRISREVFQEMRNLCNLHVRIHGLITPRNNEVRNLLYIPAVRTLEKLELIEAHVELTTILDICQHFSVKILIISGNRKSRIIGSEEGDLQLNRWNLTSLKYLQCMDVRGIRTFNFLNCFPALEYLRFKGIYHSKRKPALGIPQSVPEVVKVREYLYRHVIGVEENSVDSAMYQSNLWSVMPKLKKIVYKYKWAGDRNWTRNEYTREELKRLQLFK